MQPNTHTDKENLSISCSTFITPSPVYLHLQQDTVEKSSLYRKQTEHLHDNSEVTDGSLEPGSLAGPLHISYPIKAAPAHAFQLQSEIYWPGEGLIQQDAAATQGDRGRKERKETARAQWEVKTIRGGR